MIPTTNYNAKQHTNPTPRPQQLPTPTFLSPAKPSKQQTNSQTPHYTHRIPPTPTTYANTHKPTKHTPSCPINTPPPPIRNKQTISHAVGRIHVDDKLQFVEEPVEIMEREIKRLKRSRIPLVKVRWNSRRGPEFTWEREDSFKQKYPQLFTNRASSSTTRS
ncbi:hypothetical protein Tco_1531345 [Tanacetum coccineum]